MRHDRHPRKLYSTLISGVHFFGGSPAWPLCSEASTLGAWAEADAPFVTQFAERFFGLSYSGYQDNLDYFKQQVAEGHLSEFMADYFPPGKIREIQEKKLVLSFKAAQPPKLVKTEGVMDQFLVKGTLTTESHSGKWPQTLSTQPVTFQIGLRHISGAKGPEIGRASCRERV